MDKMMPGELLNLANALAIGIQTHFLKPENATYIFKRALKTYGYWPDEVKEVNIHAVSEKDK